MTTKIKLTFLILIITTNIFYFTNKAFAGCPPTWNIDSGNFQLCPDGTNDSKTWKITWQDGNIGYKDNFGTGQCCSRVSCYPTLEEPYSVATFIQGAAYEEWREVAYDKRCNGHSCENFGGPRSVMVTHPCHMAGGCNGRLRTISGYGLRNGICKFRRYLHSERGFYRSMQRIQRI
jgi:hypothetical protein